MIIPDDLQEANPGTFKFLQMAQAWKPKGVSILQTAPTVPVEAETSTAQDDDTASSSAAGEGEGDEDVDMEDRDAQGDDDSS